MEVNIKYVKMLENLKSNSDKEHSACELYPESMYFFKGYVNSGDLQNYKQIVVIKNSVSTVKAVIAEVREGFADVPLLFNILISNYLYGIQC